jgi:hypothetical protein
MLVKRGYTFLTSSTGLLCRYLLSGLLLKGIHVSVLVWGRRKLSLPDRIESILSHWEHELRSGKVLVYGGTTLSDGRHARLLDFIVQLPCSRDYKMNIFRGVKHAGKR